MATAIAILLEHSTCIALVIAPRKKTDTLDLIHAKMHMHSHTTGEGE